MQASVRMRLNTKRLAEPADKFKEVISIVGGRLSYLGKTAKAKDMVEQAKHMLNVEKAWLLSQIGLIEDHDDDVMDEVTPRSNIHSYAVPYVFPTAKMELMLVAAPARVCEDATRSRTRAQGANCCGREARGRH